MGRFAWVGWVAVAWTLSGAAAFAGKKHPAEEAGLRSLPSAVAVPLEFRNRMATTVKVYWIDTEGKRRLYRELKRGEAYLQKDAYVGHAWLVTDADDNALRLVFADGQQRIVDIRDDLPLAEPAGPAIPHSVVSEAVFRADGNSVLTISLTGSTRDDQTRTSRAWVRLWDVASGQAAGTLHPDEKDFTTASAGADGKTVLVAVWSGTNRSNRLVDTTTGAYIGEPLMSGSSTLRADFSPDGRWLFTSPSPTTTFRGRTSGIGGRGGPAGGAAEAPRTAESNLWDAATGLKVGDPIPSAPRASAFSPDGKVLATVVTASSGFVTQPGKVQMWDTATGKPLGEPIEANDAIGLIAFSSDGSRFVVGLSPRRDGGGDRSAPGSGGFSSTNDIELAVFDRTGAKRLADPVKIAGSFSVSDRFGFGSAPTLAILPDGKTVFAADWGHEARTWDLMEGKALRTFAHNERVSRVAASPDGRTVVTASSSFGRPATIRLWDAESGRALCDVPHEGQLRLIRFSRDGRLVLTATNDDVRVWRIPRPGT